MLGRCPATRSPGVGSSPASVPPCWSRAARPRRAAGDEPVEPPTVDPDEEIRRAAADAERALLAAYGAISAAAIQR